MDAQAHGRVGTVLAGTWRLDKVLGIGGTGAVYAATGRDGARVAIKLLHPDLAAVPQFRERLRREALAAHQVPHPSLVRVLDGQVTQDGIPYLVLELLDGLTLDDLLAKRGRLLPCDVLSLMDPVLDALASLHASGMVHRDVKPENLFLTFEGRVKLLDLGLVGLDQGLGHGPTQTGTALGTLAFMPPEQALGKKEAIGPASDVYGVGAVMFNLLSGVLPRDGSPVEMLMAAATRPVDSLAKRAPELPAALVAVVDRALRMDPRERWPSAFAMRSALHQLVPVVGANRMQGAPLAAAFADVLNMGMAFAGTAFAPPVAVPAAMPIGQATLMVRPAPEVLASRPSAPSRPSFGETMPLEVDPALLGLLSPPATVRAPPATVMAQAAMGIATVMAQPAMGMAQPAFPGPIAPAPRRSKKQGSRLGVVLAFSGGVLLVMGLGLILSLSAGKKKEAEPFAWPESSRGIRTAPTADPVAERPQGQEDAGLIALDPPKPPPPPRVTAPPRVQPPKPTVAPPAPSPSAASEPVFVIPIPNLWP
jgi:serine/threonine-protein kinase